jgi:hypothetical protein
VRQDNFQSAPPFSNSRKRDPSKPMPHFPSSTMMERLAVLRKTTLEGC